MPASEEILRSPCSWRPSMSMMTRSSGDIMPLLRQVGVVRMRSPSRRTEMFPSPATMWPRSYIQRPTMQMSRRCCSSDRAFSSVDESEGTEYRLLPGTLATSQSLSGQAHLKARRKSTLRRAESQEKIKHICRDAVIDAMDFLIAHHLVECAFHYVQQPLINFTLAPEKPLAVLDPLEVAHRNAPGIPKDVWHCEYAFIVDDGVCLPRRGTVRPFTKNLALHLAGVLFGNLVFDCGRNQHVARLEKHLASAHFDPAIRELLEGFPLPVNPLDHLGNVEPAFVKQAVADIGKADDPVAGSLHELRGQRADITETLDDHTGLFFPQPELGDGLVDANHYAPAGRFPAAAGTSQLNGLAGNYRGCGLSSMHGIGIHDPGHRLLAATDVGRGHVSLGAQPIGKLGRVAACETFELPAGHFTWI